MIRIRHGCATALFAGLFGGAASLPALASVLPERPALIVPASNEHHPGKIVYVQLMTPDLKPCKRFYTALFGYEAYDLASTGEARHLILGSDNVARASVNPFPSDTYAWRMSR